jgi:CTP:molybdopterin cytidylyltransferase MocA
MPPPPPRFSVLVANYNHAGLVGRAVESVLAQTYPAALREVIVVDDGSTDDSLARLAAFDGQPGFRVVSQDNRGQTAAFAAGLAVATGDYICLLDADDRCHPDKLAAIAEHIATLATSPEQLFLCHDLDIVDGVDGADGQPIAASWFEHINQHLLGSQLSVSAAHHGFPFAVTSGMVFGHGLLARLMAVIPRSEWAMGSDAILGHTAMVLAGEVHYLRRRLGSYLVHGSNDNARIVAGRYAAKGRWHQRRERTLMFLDLLVESLPLSAAERAERWGYGARLAHATGTVAVDRSRPQPLLSFVIDAQGASPACCEASADAAARLRDCHHELVWVADAAGLAALPAACAGSQAPVADGADAYQRLRAGHAAARGGYLCFLQAGDRPDPLCGARHLYAHRHGSLPMFTVSDLRLIDSQGALVHSGLLATANGWAGGGNVIPAFGHSLRDWPLAPLAALVIRRTPMLDAFFSVPSLPLPERLAGWLLSQYLLQLGGGARLQENLMDLRLPANATPNASWLSKFICRHGPLPEPDFAAAAEAMLAAYLRARTQERAFFSEAWEARFLGWLLQGGGAQAPARLASLAEASLPDAFAARALKLLRQPAPAPAR